MIMPEGKKVQWPVYIYILFEISTFFDIYRQFYYLIDYNITKNNN